MTTWVRLLQLWVRSAIQARVFSAHLQNSSISSIIDRFLYTHNAFSPENRQCGLGTLDHESDLHSACTSVFFFTSVSLRQPQRTRRDPQSELSPRSSSTLNKSASDEIKLHLSEVQDQMAVLLRDISAGSELEEVLSQTRPTRDHVVVLHILRDIKPGGSRNERGRVHAEDTIHPGSESADAATKKLATTWLS